MSRAGRSRFVWRKSSRSNQQGGACVEVGRSDLELVGIRDSKNANGPALLLPQSAWATFLAAGRAGVFDLT